MYSATMCNGADRVAMSVVLPTGSAAMCRTTDGALDMSGNVKEWTNDPRGTSGSGRPIYVIRGGSFDSPELGLTCGTDLSRATSDTIQATLGFRCCSTTAP
jgi:formylglycine-generating enzyme required for sulfatase activity